MVRQSNLKLAGTIIKPEIITNWFKKNNLAEYIEYLDVVDDPSWLNDGATVILGIKRDIPVNKAVPVVLKLGAFAAEHGVNELNFHTDNGQYIVRLWWD
jgi:hypothetical protein